MHLTGLSIAVNDDLTVSAGRQEVEFDGAGDDEVNTGINIVYQVQSHFLVVSTKLKVLVEQQIEMQKHLCSLRHLHSNYHYI